MLFPMISAARRWWARRSTAQRREILLALLLLFAYGFFRQVPAWNEYSRFDLIRAVVEEQTTRIDSFHDNTGDAAYFGGHWYSDKAPGSALLGIPVFVVSSVSSAISNADPDPQSTVQVLAFFESGIATAVLVLLLIRFLAPLVGAGWATGVGLAYGLGSIAFPFATMFFGHAPSTAALFGAFYLLHESKARGGHWRPVAAGCLAGWAVLIELPVALGVVALLCYAIWLGRAPAARFLLGGIPLAILLVAYDWASFGSPFAIGYQYATNFSGQNAQGIISVVWPSFDTTQDLLVGPRGLLRLAPWFALAPLGLIAARRRELRAEVVLAAAICVAFLTYNSGALNPFGGWTPGPRYLLPALPFAALLVGLAPRRVRVIAVPLMAVAAALVLVSTVTMPNAPEAFADPLFDLWLPRLLSGEIAETTAWQRWGIAGALPLSILVTGLAIGLLGIGLSFGERTLASRATNRASVLLLGLSLAFSLPVLPAGPLAPSWGTAAVTPGIVIVELGQTPIVSSGARAIELWGEVENRAQGIAAAELRFVVRSAAGQEVWSAWYGHVAIPADSRRMISLTWQPGARASGTYDYELVITDEGSGGVAARASGPRPLQLGG
jgi:hypothetical protein